MKPRLPSNTTFSFTLECVDGRWLSRSATLSKQGQTHRITFTGDQTFSDVFTPGIVSFIAPVLAEFSDRSRVYTAPEATIELPGLTLGRARIFYTVEQPENARALVRFAALAGSPHAALQSSAGAFAPVQDQVLELCVDALDWVLVPALNISVSLTSVSDLSDDNIGALKRRLERLETSQEQLLLNIDLVRKAIAGLEKGAAPAALSVDDGEKLINGPDPDQATLKLLAGLR